MTNSLQVQNGSEQHCVPVLNSNAASQSLETSVVEEPMEDTFGTGGGGNVGGEHSLTSTNNNPVDSVLISSATGAETTNNHHHDDDYHHNNNQDRHLPIANGNLNASTVDVGNKIDEISNDVSTSEPNNTANNKMETSPKSLNDKASFSASTSHHNGPTKLSIFLEHLDKVIDGVIETSRNYQEGDDLYANCQYRPPSLSSKSVVKTKRKRMSKKKSKKMKKNEKNPELEKFKGQFKNGSKQSEQDRRRNAIGPYVAIERLSNPEGGKPLLHFRVMNQPQRADDKETLVLRARVRPDRNAFSTKQTEIPATHTDEQLWLCSFCHKLPHYRQLGDLFGPYMFANPDCLELNPSTENNLVEVWMHENCVVWSNGTHFDGTRIRNLEQTYADSSQVKCSICSKSGASLRCLEKDCQLFYHFICAQDSGAEMIADHFSIFCPKHKRADRNL